MEKVDILVLGGLHDTTLKTLVRHAHVHLALDETHLEKALTDHGDAIRGIARGGHLGVDQALLERLPNLEIVANFGVGYDGIDLKRAAERQIVVTNTPDVLTEEVADTALGLLLNTARELPAAETYLRAGRWVGEGAYPLTGTLRNRTVGIVGLGRIGLAIARRLDAMTVPVVYHTRRERPDAPYRYYDDLTEMAAAVDTLMVVVPGTPETAGMINAGVLEALGPEGIIVNVGRGSAIDEPALIAALAGRTIRAAGLDVFADEPNVPEELLALDNAVLLPHVGSASIHTRDAMGQLMIDNLVAWFDGKPPLTPVPETPVPPRD
ncbi:2-hydroxyacid dehydrogenase [Bauldia sp.]|uniref:2-hydroxyacid dehydrogenase n=1 Tax=Bauldia sp. TaxID=2575872 RepID=UPI003BAA0428